MAVLDHPASAALSYWFTQYRRTWRSSVYSSFVIPLLWLTAIGYGVGGFIEAGPGTLGFDYLSYLAPGLLASIVFNTGVGECSWPVYGSIKWNKQYLPMMATPLRIVDVVAGHLGFATVRMAMTAVAFFVAMLLFGTVHSAWAPLALLAAVLTGLAAATGTYAYATTITSDNRFALLYRFLVVPLTMFSGVFFPISQLPAVVRPLAWLSPLWHGVELCRAAVLGTAPPLHWLLHVAYLGLWVGVGFALSRRLLARRLVV
ncbi:MAG: ABC transporter permease [Micromonosporaceae bacterium]